MKKFERLRIHNLKRMFKGVRNLVNKSHHELSIIGNENECMIAVDLLRKSLFKIVSMSKILLNNIIKL